MVALQRKKGLPVNRKRVLRVMRERGLLVRSRRLRARRKKEWGRVEAAEPNHIWQSDMTKIWAGPAVGWAYLVSVIDCCTREIVGWNVSITVIGGNQAKHKGAFSGKTPKVGDVAIDPTDFGYDDYYDLASKIDPKNPRATPESSEAYDKIQQEQRELKNAHITITPTSPLPKGMPSQGPFAGVDAINPPHDNGVDVYRTPTKRQARKLGRIPATVNVSFDPSGKVHCPN